MCIPQAQGSRANFPLAAQRREEGRGQQGEGRGRRGKGSERATRSEEAGRAPPGPRACVSHTVDNQWCVQAEPKQPPHQPPTIDKR